MAIGETEKAPPFVALMLERRGDHEGDSALAGAAAAGEMAARRALVERLLPGVRAMVHYLAFGDPDADDLVQLCLVEVLRAVHTYRGRSRLESWSHRITVRTCMRAISRRRRQQDRDREAALSGGATPLHAGPPSGPHQDASRLELRGALARLLGQLPPAQRVVLVLRHVHGYSLKEIARMVRAPVNTVRDRLQVGKRKLRRLIQEDPVLGEWAKEEGEP